MIGIIQIHHYNFSVSEISIKPINIRNIISKFREIVFRHVVFEVIISAELGLNKLFTNSKLFRYAGAWFRKSIKQVYFSSSFVTRYLIVLQSIMYSSLLNFIE